LQNRHSEASFTQRDLGKLVAPSTNDAAWLTCCTEGATFVGTTSNTRNSSPPALQGHHGATSLPAVDIQAYNAEIKDGDGFIGDRANNRAFKEILEDLRGNLRQFGDDPLGDKATAEIGKKTLDKILIEGEAEAAGLVHSAIEGFANELATVVSRFRRLKDWKNVQRIVVGGGLRASRVGEVAIGRAGVLVKSDGHEVALDLIRHHPDHAGLIGGIHLAPSWVFSAFDGLLAVDIGGSNIRAGVVEITDELADATVKSSRLWKHKEDDPKREDVIERLVDMLQELIDESAKEKFTLAPFIGIGCPGVINPDGSIERGAQNLPGNWESSRFNLPNTLREMIPTINKHDTHIVMHNDAVVQGLSQLPFMRDVEHWGVLTIGTGLGNASFTNHPLQREQRESKTAAKPNKKK